MIQKENDIAKVIKIIKSGHLPPLQNNQNRLEFSEYHYKHRMKYCPFCGEKLPEVE